MVQALRSREVLPKRLVPAALIASEWSTREPAFLSSGDWSARALESGVWTFAESSEVAEVVSLARRARKT
jgi:hypothetical protein